MSKQIEATFESAAAAGQAGAVRRKAGEKLRWPLLMALPLVLAAAGAERYLAGQRYAATDDAFVRAAKDSINARVAGQVVEIGGAEPQRERLLSSS